MLLPESLRVEMDMPGKGLVYNAELQKVAPQLQESFAETDQAYTQDRESYLEGLYESRLTLGNERANASIIYDEETSKANEALVVFSPFSDVEPKTSADAIIKYLGNEKPGFSDKFNAQPHSYSQISKSATIHELLKAEGKGMPVITIFSPIPYGAYEKSDKARFRDGDFAPAAKLAIEGLVNLQTQIHGLRSETKFDKLHFYGASLGASNAIGAASSIHKNGQQQLMSATAQELILGNNHHYFKLLPKLVQTIGQEGINVTPDEVPVIAEPAIRRELDAHGAEIPAMYMQMADGALKFAYMKGLTNDTKTIDAITSMVNDNIPVTVVSGVNSKLAENTHRILSMTIRDRGHNMPADSFQQTLVYAARGQKAPHLINEHVALSSTVALLGAKRATER